MCASRSQPGHPSLAARVLGLAGSRLARDAGTLAGSQYASAMAGFFTTLVGARLLGPSGYGLAVIVVALPELVLSFAMIRSNTITTKYLTTFLGTREFHKGAAVCKLGYVLDVGAGSLAFLLVLIVVKILGLKPVPEEYEWLAVAYSLSFLVSSMRGTNAAVLQSCEAFRWLGAVEFTDKALTLVLSILAIGAGFGVTGFVLAAAAGPVVAGLIGAGAAYAMLRRKGVPAWVSVTLRSIRELRREIGAALGWNYLTAVWSGLLAQGPVLLLGWRLGSAQAGYYQLGVTIATAASYPEIAMARVVYPVLSRRLANGPIVGLWGTIQRWTLKGGLPTGALILMGIFVAPVIIPAIYGPSFQPVTWVAQLLLVGAVASAILFWLNPLLNAAGRFRQWSQAFGGYVISALALGLPAISLAGVAGMAAVAGLGKAVFTLLVARWARRTLASGMSPGSF